MEINVRVHSLGEDGGSIRAVTTARCEKPRCRLTSVASPQRRDSDWTLVFEEGGQTVFVHLGGEAGLEALLEAVARFCVDWNRRSQLMEALARREKTK